jgi:RNA polymerase sigma-70 factor, ECF subfamily
MVLKDIFDFTAEEIAVLLSTTVGAVKSALHRGRINLQETSHDCLAARPVKGINRSGGCDIQCA